MARWMLAGLTGAILMSACGLRGPLPIGGRGAGDVAATAAADGAALAPDVFEVAGEGLWGGRPSLGGVWVAHPDVDRPERVLIRDTVSGRTVTGALFRRERDAPGPVFQISAAAARALGLAAGVPVVLNVTALAAVGAAREDEARARERPREAKFGEP